MAKRLKAIEYKAIREETLAHVKSVNYPVSLRWAFYRMLQDGKYIKDKKDWNNFKSIIAKARKDRKDGWEPDTLVDETRSIVWRGIGYVDKKDWYEYLKRQECNLDKIQSQDYFLMILFEAKAMINQFKYYTRNIPLCAFGGDVSIPMKFEIAKQIEYADEKYHKPIVILYFGDCDEKGKQIHKSALKDIKDWCSIDFDFIPCGLTIEQAKAFKLPTNPDKPNNYQWEALTDEQAKALITKSVEKYQDKTRYKSIETKEKRITNEYRKLLGMKGGG
jgi:hypothetical protein